MIFSASGHLPFSPNIAPFLCPGLPSAAPPICHFHTPSTFVLTLHPLCPSYLKHLSCALCRHTQAGTTTRRSCVRKGRAINSSKFYHMATNHLPEWTQFNTCFLSFIYTSACSPPIALCSSFSGSPKKLDLLQRHTTKDGKERPTENEYSPSILYVFFLDNVNTVESV